MAHHMNDNGRNEEYDGIEAGDDDNNPNDHTEVVRKVVLGRRDWT